MPELPEVETVRIGLDRLVPGKRVQHVTFDWPKGFPNAQGDVDAFLIGASIKHVRRRAKVLIIDLSTDYSLLIHLKMTGQLVYVSAPLAHKADNAIPPLADTATVVPASDYDWLPDKLAGTKRQPEVRFGAGHPNDSLIGDLPDKSTRVTLSFDDGSRLFFNDQRKFGWMKLLPTDQIEQEPFFQKVGPEPLEQAFTWQVLRDRLQRRRKTSIKAALLDQSVLAGVGNIYADECLWGAQVHPSTLVQDVPETRIKAIHRALVDVLRLSIAKGGSSNHTYVNAEGKKGSYMNFANVFRRDGQPCPRCGTTIIKSRVAGRGTHTCPQCQKQ